MFPDSSIKPVKSTARWNDIPPFIKRLCEFFHFMGYPNL